jgi:hypothetical protein
MTRHDRISGLIRLALLALIFIIGGLIEPCDGKSCGPAGSELRAE